MNKELKETIIDEKTGIEYHLEGDYYIPNLVLPKQEKVTLNKYGRMRLKYLKENKKAEYSIMLMDGTLTNHIFVILVIALIRVNHIFNDLIELCDFTEDLKDTIMLFWVGTMNAIKNQAEELVISELIYV